MNHVTTIKKVTSVYFQGTNRCLVYREAEEVLPSDFQKKGSSRYAQAVLAHEIVEEYLKGDISLSEIESRVMESISPSFTDISTKQDAEYLSKILYRYCSSENRKAFFLIPCICLMAGMKSPFAVMLCLTMERIWNLLSFVQGSQR